ncbi:MAG: aminodeoxychorismate/anthranilate synthase component II [Deltaproteobacteria bacterium]|nr:aminodeoxychorismate/anthranilate synthase component II [Deltaproteobacteria bacterium]MDH3774008.1 aminodeoxychorismate/anthranilate synthase component II [Deltaproteobacteria bacterium]MDH3851821.1 aminodeoxychorismate/anthranilate synthase component II [Deltaproteobacteria bacterium]MDH3928205.1 aminodeoxychorismate/anthranilate synthase component II [Deltaproteobacteria bacterium]MDH3950110.1 aminodeoxychorismate/anthranilate synthase component II [Deltaproteobacteria bacterium]
MILMIDNYDSFTYNLVQYLGVLGAEVEVRRNDKVTLDEIETMKPERIVISPGPGTPQSAGITISMIERFHPKVPILGVCLGHQAIGAAFGGRVLHAARIMHGKTSEISHDSKGVFRDLPDPITATRYHSLAVERKSLPSCLEVSAEAEDGEIMGLRHRQYPVEGIQFHPESILTKEGMNILRNFLKL